MSAMPLRFADIRLGQAVDFGAAMLPDRLIDEAPIDQTVCDMVQRWSGASAASLVSLEVGAEHEASTPLAGRVMARQMDGSGMTYIEVVMRAQHACTRAVVRVALG